MPSLRSSERLIRAISVLAPHLQPPPMRGEIPSGLSLGTARVLIELATMNPEPAVGDLSKRLKLPLPRISKLLGELENLGFIERKRFEEDRRRVVVALQPAGKRAIALFRRAHRQRLEQFLDVLGTRDTEQLLRIFERAAHRLSDRESESLSMSDGGATL